MAAISHIKFLTFDRIALESYVIPHWHGYFHDSTIQGHPEAESSAILKFYF